MDSKPRFLRSLIRRRQWQFLGIAMVGGLLATNPSQASAPEFQSLTSIRMQVSAFIEAYPYKSPYPARYKLGALDARLRLKACHAPLAIEFARADRTSGNTAIRVQCPMTPGWKIHYPARVELFDDVLVTAKPLVMGQNIDESAVEFRKINVTRLNHGYFQNAEALRDLQAKRNIARGAVLSPANMAPRLLVRAGQQVTLIAEINGLRIKAIGRAMRSASLGQPVNVKNTSTQRIVEGVVAGEALVKVGI